MTQPPNVSNGVWTISEFDLECLSIGTCIQACGGSGHDDYGFLIGREKLRAGKVVRIIDIDSLTDDAVVGWGDLMGALEPLLERLTGDEYQEALEAVQRYTGSRKYHALLAVEIGWVDGLIQLFVGSNWDIPVIDADCEARSYPTGCQNTIVVDDLSGKGKDLIPAAISSDDGTIMLLTSTKDAKTVDSALRAACADMGSLVGFALGPLSGSTVKRSAI